MSFRLLYVVVIQFVYCSLLFSCFFKQCETNVACILLDFDINFGKGDNKDLTGYLTKNGQGTFGM